MFPIDYFVAIIDENFEIPCKWVVAQGLAWLANAFNYYFISVTPEIVSNTTLNFFDVV